MAARLLFATCSALAPATKGLVFSPSGESLIELPPYDWLLLMRLVLLYSTSWTLITQGTPLVWPWQTRASQHSLYFHIRR